MNPIIEVAAIVAGVFTGFFALVKYFLNHLTTKNGHLERIADKFNETTLKFISSLDSTASQAQHNFEETKREHEAIINRIDRIGRKQRGK